MPKGSEFVEADTDGDGLSEGLAMHSRRLEIREREVAAWENNLPDCDSFPDLKTVESLSCTYDIGIDCEPLFATAYGFELRDVLSLVAAAL